MTELEKLISQPSDINEHLPIMYEYAKECSHITELGVRDIVSTWAWVTANPKKVVCYDVVMPPQERSNDLINYCRTNSINFEFNLQDDLQATLEPTELLFIDTVHTYEQLSAELKLHADKSSKYIILHDTEGFGEVGIDIHNNKTKGLRPAIAEFLLENPHWVIEKEFKNCFGLTILKRIHT